IKDILAHPEPNAIDFLDTIKLNLFASEIYVFTPKGDLLTLPAGATVLDFAFAIHSHLGMHCIAGKINHRLVPLSHKLDSGDQVEIITSDSQSPQPEWLEFCKSAKAQSRIRAVLRKDEKQLLERGKTIFHDLMEAEGITPSNEFITKVLANYQLKNRDDLYLMLANDEINLSAGQLTDLQTKRNSLWRKLLRNPFSSKKKDKEKKRAKINRKETYILHPDDKNPNYRIASCCSPIPGDDVLGFIDDDETVVVHQVSCPEAMRLKTAYGPRLVATQWGGVAEKFLAAISVDGIDRLGILEELVSTLSQRLGINIRSLNIQATHEVFHCDLTALVENAETVDEICKALLKIKGIKFAQRTS
ncbi:MAG: TGS domain-containing protein, partial [Muribaculaceae bacterium]|nr:TGS domain-containing protein [Muribaculaceae bacterium]